MDFVRGLTLCTGRVRARADLLRELISCMTSRTKRLRARWADAVRRQSTRIQRAPPTRPSPRAGSGAGGAPPAPEDPLIAAAPGFRAFPRPAAATGVVFAEKSSFRAKTRQSRRNFQPT
jgi:hypothetical protein